MGGGEGVGGRVAGSVGGVGLGGQGGYERRIEAFVKIQIFFFFFWGGGVGSGGGQVCGGLVGGGSGWM